MSEKRRTALSSMSPAHLAGVKRAHEVIFTGTYPQVRQVFVSCEGVKPKITVLSDDTSASLRSAVATTEREILNAAFPDMKGSDVAIDLVKKTRDSPATDCCTRDGGRT